MNFYVGQKVVCISGYGHRLIKGSIYTVAGLGESCGCFPEMVRLQEIVHWDGVCSICGEHSHGAFKKVRFRPLDELHDQLERIEKEGAPLELETVEQ